MLRILACAAILALGVAAAAADLDVMSFNLRYGTADDGLDAWPLRRGLVIAVIENADPDLLGTQECLDFQREELAAALPNYAVVGVGRDDGDRAGEMCACFYRGERFLLLDSGTFWLSETPGEVASRGWDAALPRIATWLRLRDLELDRELLWLNTHLDHQGEEARRRSLALLHDWLAAQQGSASLVVTGDFNLPADPQPGSAQQLLLGDLLVDTWTAVHGRAEPVEGTFNGFGHRPRPGRIDWILVSPDLEVAGATIVRRRGSGRWPSDHCPVTATLRLDPRPAPRE